MIRVKLPLGGVNPDSSTPSPTRRAVHAAEEGPHHHAAEHPVPPRAARGGRRGLRSSAAPGSRAARRAATRSATSPATPTRASPTASSSTSPLRRRVRPLLRAQRGVPAAPAQVQGGLHRHRRRPRDHEHPRPRLPPAHPDGGEGVEIRTGGGTRSCRAWRPSTSSWRGQRDYLKVSEAVLRVFDRRGPAHEPPAARLKFMVDRIGIDAFRRRSTASWRATGSASATSTPRPISSCTTRRRTRPRSAPATPRRTATAASSTASWRRT